MTATATPINSIDSTDLLHDQMQVWTHYNMGNGNYNTVQQYLASVPTVTTVNLLSDSSTWVMSIWNTAVKETALTLTLSWNNTVMVTRSITNPGTGPIGFEVDIAKNILPVGLTEVGLALSMVDGNSATALALLFLFKRPGPGSCKK